MTTSRRETIAENEQAADVAIVFNGHKVRIGVAGGYNAEPIENTKEMSSYGYVIKMENCENASIYAILSKGDYPFCIWINAVMLLFQYAFT
jgi:hypothetical protein